LIFGPCGGAKDSGHVERILDSLSVLPGVDAAGLPVYSPCCSFRLLASFLPEVAVSHRTALYTVRVRQSRAREYRLLGDIDDAGTNLADALAGFLANLEVPNEDGTKVVRCDSVTAAGDGLQLMLSHGRRQP